MASSEFNHPSTVGINTIKTEKKRESERGRQTDRQKRNWGFVSKA